ncbi:MAG: hypothetical protein JSS62_04020 [Verrucomicrobia bacterium]|nr:hypothetical protein [Verrucomicrobiota bacterium]MBS0647062.1 hypothetical protein [Verrucomicrobiota bacterium]
MGDYVSDRKLEVSAFSVPSDIYQTSLSTYQGLLTLNWCERFEIYAGLGSTQLELFTPASSFNYQFTGVLQNITLLFTAFSRNNYPIFDPNGLMSVSSISAFSYTLGGSGVICSFKNLALSASGSYFYTNPPIAEVVLPTTIQNNAISSFVEEFSGDSPTVAPSVVYLPNSSFKYQEWQTDLCLAYAIYISRSLKAVPFAAIEWSGVFATFANALVSSTPPSPLTVDGSTPLFGENAFTATLYNLRQQRNFGFTIGTSFVGKDRFAAGVEWRFINETAFCVDLNMSF